MRAKRIFRIFVTIAIWAISSIIANGQQPYFQKSPRPSSFTTVLPGLSNYNFDYEDKELYNFPETYFFVEIRKWIEAVRPGITLGIDYRKPSTEHVTISHSFSSRGQLARTGVYWWYISNINITFTIESLNYKYSYNVPDFRIAGNNFDDHTLYNHLLGIIDKVYSYNKSSTLRLPDYRSGYDEASLKNIWESDGCQLYEGIYEDIASDKGRKENKYKLALKYVDGRPCLIYLNGANLYDDWKEGEFKAWLEPTSTANLFKAQWLMADKSISTFYVSFDTASMKVFSSDDHETSTYLKLFPTASDNMSTTGTGISYDEWSGTGFALKNGYIVTNFHVVDGAKSIEVHGVNGNSSSNYSASVVATDKTNDLAIIQITDSGFTGFGNIPYAVKNQMADVGEDVWVLGYPLTQVLGNEIKLTNGVVSSRSGYQGDVSTYQISAPVQPGNSGGPLFDSKGNVVGIVNAGVSNTENVGYAIKSSYLRNLAESYSISSVLPSNNTISTLSLKDQVKRVNNFVFMLRCSSKSSSVDVASSSTSIKSGGSSASVKGDSSIEMTLSKTSLPLKVGESAQLYASNYGATLKWESDDPNIATVSSGGLVKGVSPGKTTIWALGKQAKACWVTVNGNTSGESTSKTLSQPNDATRMVDLGLSVKWADRNLGASSSTDVGGYYAWGETVAKNEFTQGNYKWYDNESYSYPGNLYDISGSSFDPAKSQLGSSRRMPTEAEFDELINNCTFKWTTDNGVTGYKVTGKNGNSIFLPCNGTNNQTNEALGQYWTSEATSSSIPHSALMIDFNSSSVTIESVQREWWGGIRAVSGSKTLPKTSRRIAYNLFDEAYEKYVNEDYLGAFELTGKSIAAYPSNDAYFLRGVIALSYLDKFESAKDSFYYLITNGYQTQQIILYYAYSLYHNKEYGEAIAQFDRFISGLDTKDELYLMALYHKARCYDELKNWSEAIAVRQKALELEGKINHNFGYVYNNIAWGYLNLNQVSEATSYIKKAIKLDHNEDFIWDTYGETQYKMGNYEQCVTSMNNAIAIFKANGTEENANPFFYRGLAKIKLGNVAGGFVDLEKASELGYAKATEELSEIDASGIDFSSNGTFRNVVEKEITSSFAGNDTKIVRIELSEESTIVYVQYTNTKYETGGWYAISPDAYIRDKSTGKKYLLLTAQNCAISPEQTAIDKGTTKTFSLIFPALPKDTKQIDFVEAEDSHWKFYNIDLH